MNFGMPYKGSKNRIAENLISQLPAATHFYDLFGGGGAITHCALVSGRFVHYNELDPLVFKGFKMFINGNFKSEDRWISREDFSRLKDSDPYVAICFSFANNLKNYCYDEETELFKKAVHYSICFNDNSLLSGYIDLSGFKYSKTDLKERRLELQMYFTYLYQKCYNPNLKNIEKFVSFNPTLSVKNISQNLERLDILNNFSSGNIPILTNITTVKTVEIRDFNHFTGKDEPVFKITNELCTDKIQKDFPEDELVNVLKELAFRDFVKNGSPAPRQTYSIEVLGDHGTITILELL